MKEAGALLMSVGAWMTCSAMVIAFHDAPHLTPHWLRSLALPLSGLFVELAVRAFVWLWDLQGLVVAALRAITLPPALYVASLSLFLPASKEVRDA